MGKTHRLLLGLVIIPRVFAAICPDPLNSSLQWGVPPYPWTKNPFSMNAPQGDPATRFSKANILVAGIGRGVSCTYRMSSGEYSIWQEVLVKLPARMDHQWVDVLGGFVCIESREACVFYLGSE